MVFQDFLHHLCFGLPCLSLFVVAEDAAAAVAASAAAAAAAAAAEYHFL